MLLLTLHIHEHTVKISTITKIHFANSKRELKMDILNILAHPVDESQIPEL